MLLCDRRKYLESSKIGQFESAQSELLHVVRTTPQSITSKKLADLDQIFQKKSKNLCLPGSYAPLDDHIFPF
jgi:hypothetical protein